MLTNGKLLSEPAGTKFGYYKNLMMKRMLNCHIRRRKYCDIRTVYIHLPKMIAIKKRFVIALFQAAHYLIWTQTLITLWLLLFVSVHSEYIFHTVQLSGTHAEWSCIACIFFSPLLASFSRGLQEFRIWWHPLHDVSSYPAEEEKHRQKNSALLKEKVQLYNKDQTDSLAASVIQGKMPAFRQFFGDIYWLTRRVSSHTKWTLWAKQYWKLQKAFLNAKADRWKY